MMRAHCEVSHHNWIIVRMKCGGVHMDGSQVCNRKRKLSKTDWNKYRGLVEDECQKSLKRRRRVEDTTSVNEVLEIMSQAVEAVQKACGEEQIRKGVPGASFSPSTCHYQDQESSKQAEEGRTEEKFERVIK